MTTETQAKLDITTDAPEWRSLVCDAEGKWSEVHVTERDVCQCPKCLDKGFLAEIEEARDEANYFEVHNGALDKVNALRKELGYPKKKVKK